VSFGDFDLDLDLDVNRVDGDAVGHTSTPFLTVEGRCLCLFPTESKICLYSGGASSVKEPGHFKVRKSSSQVTWSQERSQNFTLGATEAKRRGGTGVTRIFFLGALF